MTHSILVVDDDQNILLTIQDILSSEGFPVRTARNGREGIASVEAETPALIVLDLWMPLMDGREMARHLRREGYVIPILVMSAIQAGSDIARELQVDGFLPKPFDIDRLLEEIDRLLSENSR